MRKTIAKKEESIIDYEKLGISVEQLVRSIRDISRGMEVLSNSGLRKDTIELLVSKASGVNMTLTHNVIWGLENLEKKFLK